MRRIGGITASRLPSSDVLVRLRGGIHGPDEREGDFGTSWPAGPPGQAHPARSGRHEPPARGALLAGGERQLLGQIQQTHRVLDDALISGLSQR